MSLETSRHGVQLELSRARLVQFAQHLVFPNHSRGHHADGGFVPAGVPAIWRLERGAAVRHHLPRDGRAPRHASLHARARANPARLAHFADALDLSPDAQLLRLESNPACHQRRLGQLGQTRAHRQRAGAGMRAGGSMMNHERIASDHELMFLLCPESHLRENRNRRNRLSSNCS
jgi:hypothetical protein